MTADLSMAECTRQANSSNFFNYENTLYWVETFSEATVLCQPLANHKKEEGQSQVWLNAVINFYSLNKWSNCLHRQSTKDLHNLHQNHLIISYAPRDLIVGKGNEDFDNRLNCWVDHWSVSCNLRIRNFICHLIDQAQSPRTSSAQLYNDIVMYMTVLSCIKQERHLDNIDE